MTDDECEICDGETTFEDVDCDYCGILMCEGCQSDEPGDSGNPICHGCGAL